MKKIISLVIVTAVLLSCGPSVLAGSYCPHSLVDVLENSDPTCNSAGIYRFRCKDCGYTNAIITPAIEHDWKDIKVYMEATCVSQGDASSECRMCGVRIRRNTPVNDNHDWKEVSRTPSTCTSS